MDLEIIAVIAIVLIVGIAVSMVFGGLAREGGAAAETEDNKTTPRD